MTDFDNAPHEFVRLISDCLGSETLADGRILRDVYGRLSFVTRNEADERFEWLSNRAAEVLGPYGAPKAELLASLSPDDSTFLAFLSEPSIGISIGGQCVARMIDRRVAGGEWLIRPTPLAPGPGRLIFHSVKGGVGRSTALAITAADLASRGYNLLVIDMDLEAPGLGSLLLSPDDAPRFGVVDWFAAVAAGADSSSLIPDMTGSSPFTSASAVVDVVPAMGNIPGAYISKLARAYMPGSAGVEYAGSGFPDKARGLVAGLLSRRSYDAVLIDARAGLHETSGGLLMGLGAQTLLFGVDTPQTFDDLSIMLRAFADVFDPDQGAEDFRSRFKMVHAKAPRDEKDRQPFKERSWQAWSETLYDDVDPETELQSDPFVFDLGDESAPHYPLEIIGDETYSRFDPRTQTYPMSAEAYSPIFGGFLKSVREILDLS